MWYLAYFKRIIQNIMKNTYFSKHFQKTIAYTANTVDTWNTKTFSNKYVIHNLILIL